MSLCDLGLSLKFWIAIVTQAPVSMERNKFICLLSAISGNFFAIATVSWYFIISVCVYSVFQPAKSRWRWILTHESLQHIYVWSLAIFGALLPWWSDNYGDMDDGTQCWIPGLQDPMKLTLLLPLFIYLVFAIYLLIYVFFMSKTPFALNTRLKERMLSFVGVFTCAWIWPALAGIWDFSSPGTIPVILHYMDVGVVCGSGLFNFVVWITHPAYRKALCQIIVEKEETLLGNDTNESHLKVLSSAEDQPSGHENRIDQETAYKTGVVNNNESEEGLETSPTYSVLEN